MPSHLNMHASLAVSVFENSLRKLYEEAAHELEAMIRCSHCPGIVAAV
jgi:hypothetical protein